MRLVILGMCALVAAGVFAAMFLAIWSTRPTPEDSTAFRQSRATELVWAAIPGLMMLAAAIPAVIAIASAPTGDWNSPRMRLTVQRLLLRRTRHDYEAIAVRAVTAVSFSFLVSPQAIQTRAHWLKLMLDKTTQWDVRSRSAWSDRTHTIPSVLARAIAPDRFFAQAGRGGTSLIAGLAARLLQAARQRYGRRVPEPLQIQSINEWTELGPFIQEHPQILSRGRESECVMQIGSLLRKQIDSEPAQELPDRGGRLLAWQARTGR